MPSVSRMVDERLKVHTVYYSKTHNPTILVIGEVNILKKTNGPLCDKPIRPAIFGIQDISGTERYGATDCPTSLCIDKVDAVQLSSDKPPFHKRNIPSLPILPTIACS